MSMMACDDFFKQSHYARKIERVRNLEPQVAASPDQSELNYARDEGYFFTQKNNMLQKITK